MEAGGTHAGCKPPRNQLSVLLCVWFAAVVLARDGELPPAWTVSLPERIEWAHVVGPTSRPVLLVATAAGHLHLLDAGTGDGLTDEPLVAGRGVRLTEGNAQASDVVYCFDRHAVYGLKLTPPAGMRWRSGQAPKSDDYPGDPEGLSQRVGACVTPDGVLVVDNDGRVRLLDPADGSERCTAQLRRLPTARLAVSGSLVAILAPLRDGTQALFLEPCARVGSGAVHELRVGWPIWYRLLGQDLVLLSPPQVAVQPRDGPCHTWTLDLPTVRAAAVDVYVPPDHTSPRAPATAPDSQSSGVVLLVGGEGQIRAHDAGSGRLLWTCSGTRQDAYWHSITVEGDRFVAAGDQGVLVGEATSGRVVATLDARDMGPGTRVVAWHLGEQELWAVLTAGALEGMPEALLLIRTRVPSARTDVTRKDARGVTAWISGTTRPRAVLWPPGQVVVVETNALRAFDLP